MPNSSEPSGKKLTVVIPNWNDVHWLPQCLAALQRQNVPKFDTVLVDNGSSDGSIDFVRNNYPDVEILALTENTGFANAANVGIAQATTPYVALLNADTEPFPDWLAKLLEAIEGVPAHIGAIASQMLQMDDPTRLDDAGDALSWYGAATKCGHGRPACEHDKEREIFSPCAGACLFRREFLDKTGGFDPAFFAYLEDVDLGLRGGLLGYRYLYVPAAKVLHKGQGAGIRRARYVELVTRNRLLLFVKNIPLPLLLRRVPKLIYGQIYFFIAYAHPLASMKGYLSFLVGLPGALRKRRQILRSIAVDPRELDGLLGKTPPQPSLSDLFRAYFSRLSGRQKSIPGPFD